MRSGRWRTICTVAVWTVTGAERVAACPACFGASEGRVLYMYLVSAALLSLLPFAIVGGIIWWWRRAAVRLAP